MFVLLVVVAAIAFYIAQLAGYAWIAGHAIGRRPVTLWGTLGAVCEHACGLLLRLGRRMFARSCCWRCRSSRSSGFVWLTTLAGRDVNYYLVGEAAGMAHARAGGRHRRGRATRSSLLAQFARWLFAMPIAMFHRLRPADVLRGERAHARGTVAAFDCAAAAVVGWA